MVVAIAFRFIMTEICKILKMENFADFQKIGQGYAARHDPERGKFAFEILINDPLSSEQIDKIVEFAVKSNAELIRDLYSLCNGLWAARFGVFGLRSGPWGLQQPWDINVPNYFERPASLPSDYLIVGNSFEIDADGTELKFSHIITGDGRIIVVQLNTPTVIRREYSSIESWLTEEVSAAIAA